MSGATRCTPCTRARERRGSRFARPSISSCSHLSTSFCSLSGGVSTLRCSLPDCFLHSSGAVPFWPRPPWARAFYQRSPPVWIAAVVATHPILVWAGTEIRVYALIVLLSALLTLAFFDAHWASGRRGTQRILFAALALLCVYTQYYLASLLACFGLVLLVRRDRQSVERYAGDMGVVALLAFPLVLAARMQLGSHQEDFGPPSPFGAGTLHLVATRLEGYVFSFNKAIDEARWSLGAIRIARWMYRALVLAVIAAPLWSWRRRAAWQSLVRRGRCSSSWPATRCACSFCFAWRDRSAWESDTRVAIVIPALIAAMSVPAFALGRLAAVLGAAFLIVSNVAATLLTQVIPLAKDCDCRRVAETLGTREAERTCTPRSRPRLMNSGHGRTRLCHAARRRHDHSGAAMTASTSARCPHPSGDANCARLPARASSVALLKEKTYPSSLRAQRGAKVRGKKRRRPKVFLMGTKLHASCRHQGEHKQRDHPVAGIPLHALPVAPHETPGNTACTRRAGESGRMEYLWVPRRPHAQCASKNASVRSADSRRISAYTRMLVPAHTRIGE